MSLTGSFLAADLSDLEMIGTVDLPMLAYIYAEMNNAIANSNDDGPAFAVPGGGGNDQVGAAWTGLRNRLQNILGNTSTALTDAGTAIVSIARAYAANDTAAAAALNSVWARGVPMDRLTPTEIIPPGPPSTVTIA